MYARDRATRELGIRLVDVAPGRAVLSMKIRPHMVQGHASCHGGYIFTLADSAFAFSCNTRNEAMVGIGCSIDYIAPAFLGDILIASGIEMSRGKRNGHYDVRVENQHHELIALFHGRSYRVKGAVIQQENEQDE